MSTPRSLAFFRALNISSEVKTYTSISMVFFAEFIREIMSLPLSGEKTVETEAGKSRQRGGSGYEKI